MLPEISRRCPSCGASVRDADALFCAECGKPLSKNAAETAVAITEPDKVDAPESSQAEASAPVVAGEETGSEVEAAARQAAPSVPTAPSPVARGAETHPHRIADKTRETLHRASGFASAAARGVIEEPAKRVEKIRHASTHVIEEASYDPSLRFVLVALGLFVVFIILLVLSKVMG